eukprot:CAMPEP_0115390208 /NCGR_PEP_ID=MMETSP0271-20121206/10083_1 /TAXON_ID=71861 /ORGANISM="Scrippsiella trochoidea, Strain CCMP3099" /LENGTH=161 /DNA_ID=CAMNT_0002813743 /DNA_START=187 /DNA_END=673 /DNA_ORIENTATION=-
MWSSLRAAATRARRAQPDTLRGGEQGGLRGPCTSCTEGSRLQGGAKELLLSVALRPLLKLPEGDRLPAKFLADKHLLGEDVDERGLPAVLDGPALAANGPRSRQMPRSEALLVRPGCLLLSGEVSTEDGREDEAGDARATESSRAAAALPPMCVLETGGGG